MKAGVKKLLRTGLMPARAWRIHAVGMSPTEGVTIKETDGSGCGQKSTTSLSLFMEAYGLEEEEELSTMATQHWAEGVWTGKWRHEQKEAWMRQIQEVQTWKQERGPAGAVMCETCDLGVKWPYWHTLVFSDETKVDMRYVCPRDAEKMPVQIARSVYWKKWAAEHQQSMDWSSSSYLAKESERGLD